MTPERGYFKWKGDKAVWVASKNGPWEFDPINGARQIGDPFIVGGKDMLKLIDEAVKEKVKNYKV